MPIDAVNCVERRAISCFGVNANCGKKRNEKPFPKSYRTPQPNVTPLIPERETTCPVFLEMADFGLNFAVV